MNIRKIPTAVTRRACPGCGYAVDQIMVEQARLDFSCPKCSGYKFIQFRPLTLGGEQKP